MKKIIKVLYPNHTHISIPCKKHMHSFKTIGGKLQEGLRPQGTHCLHTLIAFHTEKQKTEVYKAEKERRNNQRIIFKRHAHLHSMQKTSEKFQNNPWKTVRGVAPTKYPVCFHLKGQLNLGDSIISLLKI